MSKAKNERGRRNMRSRNEDEGTSGIQKNIGAGNNEHGENVGITKRMRWRNKGRGM
jgi:hypothetical protein